MVIFSRTYTDPKLVFKVTAFLKSNIYGYSYCNILIGNNT